MTDASRLTYHHGALREALVRAGLDLSRGAGAGAIVLREATRRAGVSARAAYRHFADRDALVRAVAVEALASMAERIRSSQGDAADGVALLRGVGLGSIGFALDEPGWFDVAVLAMPDMISGPVPVPDVPGSTVYGTRSPYRLLSMALAALVREGRLAPDRVTDAAITCWSGVHGFCLLANGPLSGTPRAALDAQARRHVDTLVAAVSTPRVDGGDP